MVDKTELQTGSLVNFNNSVYTIKRSDLELTDLFTFFSPIQTTTIWLGNFGFERTLPKMNREAYRHPKFPNLFVIVKNGLASEIITQISKDDWKTLVINIYYVHLFQTKWQFLTKQELLLNFII